jgi:hypothetical protein
MDRLRNASTPANSILPIGVGHDQTGCPAPHLWDGRGDGCGFLWKPAERRWCRRTTSPPHGKGGGHGGGNGGGQGCVAGWKHPVRGIADASVTLVNIEGGLIVGTGQHFSAYSTQPNHLGTVNNQGGGVNVSGTMTIAANLVQPGNNGNGQIDIINGGHLTLAGSVTGGGIGITSGMLEFAPSPQFLHQPETASEHFNAWLAFGGLDGALKFDGISGALSVNLALNDLTVSNQGHQIADFHLAQPQQPYSPAEFSVRGSEVLYHHIT